jgi:hypothetical protein
MSVTTGSIATAGQAQWVNINPSTAQNDITFANQSNDIIVVSWDGGSASYSHGYKIAPGSSITMSVAAAAAGNGPAFPGGLISLWGPAAGQAFSVAIDQ